MSATQPRDPLASLRIERTAGKPITTQRSGRFGKFLWLLFFLALLAGTGYWGATTGRLSFAKDWFAVPEMIQNRTEVRVTRVSVQKGQSADALVVASGYLESRRQAKIGARAPGRVESVHVEEGSTVTQGQTLAVLEHADMDASLNAVKASLAKAKASLEEQVILIARNKRDLDRAKDMRGGGGISEQDYDKARYEYESAVARKSSLEADVQLSAARVAESEQLRENMFIRAPFDGTVISKDAEVGESILPGGMGEASGRGSAVTIADLEHLEVDCDVKEDFINRVSEGQAAEIAVDAVPGYRYRGRVRKIIPMGDRARATIKVKVEILDVDKRLFPDMSGTAYFLPPQESKPEDLEKERYFCPTNAVVTEESGSFVWQVNENNRVQRLSITMREARDGKTEVLTGLSGKERIVVQPPVLEEGNLVKISE